MRTIERSVAFKRDYKRLIKGRYRSAITHDLVAVLSALINDKKLSPKQHDHELIGNWHGYRECHIKADLLLVYSCPDAKTLRLARLGTHSEIFG